MVEGGGLENRFPVLRNGGSNPSPSATVALLRGINNAGSKRVTMAALKSAFESMGFKNVRTVLASGNVVFESPRRDPQLGRTIARGLEKALGFRVIVILRTVLEMRALVASDPFRSEPFVPGVLFYVTFLARKIAADPGPSLPRPAKGVRIVRAGPGEVFSVVRPSAEVGTPDLMAFLDKTFGREVTTRNWRTVMRIAGS